VREQQLEQTEGHRIVHTARTDTLIPTTYDLRWDDATKSERLRLEEHWLEYGPGGEFLATAPHDSERTYVYARDSNLRWVMLEPNHYRMRVQITLAQTKDT
jgi:hypothetical protein